MRCAAATRRSPPTRRRSPRREAEGLRAERDAALERIEELEARAAALENEHAHAIERARDAEESGATLEALLAEAEKERDELRRRVKSDIAFALERLAAVGAATEELIATLVEAAARPPEPEAPETADEEAPADASVEDGAAEGEAAASADAPVLDAFDELANEALDGGDAGEDAARDDLWGGPRN